MYGFGSKKQLLEDFASTTLTDFTVVVINGYLPSVNLKQVWSCLPNIIPCSSLQDCFEILSMSQEIMKCIGVPNPCGKGKVYTKNECMNLWC
jgi:hypothetical protein